MEDKIWDTGRDEPAAREADDHAPGQDWRGKTEP